MKTIIFTRRLPIDWKDHGPTVVNLCVAAFLDEYVRPK